MNFAATVFNTNSYDKVCLVKIKYFRQLFMVTNNLSSFFNSFYIFVCFRSWTDAQIGVFRLIVKQIFFLNLKLSLNF